MTNNKILDPESIAKLARKNPNEKIILCHGVFDLIHYGHIMHFQSAKKYGSKLIVSVTADAYVNKGPGRPLYNQEIRMKVLASFEFIDYVCLSDDHTPEAIIKKIQPNYYVKGKDYKDLKKDITKKIIKEKNIVEKYGGKIIFTNDELHSSSKIINLLDLTLNKDQNSFLKNLRLYIKYKEVTNYFEQVRKFKPLIFGEAIIDSYTFSESIGKSAKDPFLVVQEIDEKKYLGGSLIVANHISNFCNKVNLLTSLGKEVNLNAFIKKNLNNNINLIKLNTSSSKTIVKKRFVDKLTSHKLLGVYSIPPLEVNKKIEQKTINNLQKYSKKHKDIIITDYGHGLISEKIIKTLTSSFKSIYLNVQINSANTGYQTFKKYKKCNVLFINENELRFCLRDNTSDINLLISKVKNHIEYNKIIITRGSLGVTLFDNRSNKTYLCPAFAKSVKDKIGAGDAFLSVYSIFDKLDINEELNLLLSSMSAAVVVENMGNSKSIDSKQILKNLEHMLK